MGGEGLEQMFHEVSSSRVEDEDDELGESSSLSGDSDNGDDDSDAEEDAAEDSNICSHGDSHGPLHELSSLVSQLPIKRGLSKFYQGKSQSFSSFSDVRCAEDLAKKETPIKRSMKPSRSYAGGLDDDAATHQTHNSYCGPYNNNNNNNNKANMIPKKGNMRGSCASSIARTSSGSSYFAGGKPPPIPMHKNT